MAVKKISSNLKEHKYNLTKGLLEKSKLAQLVHDKWPQNVGKK
jgi:hypothetical protein